MRLSIIIAFAAICLNFSINAQQNYSTSIVVDQFGYTPNANKVAILRQPKVGYDSNIILVGGGKLILKDAATDKIVYTSDLISWKNGATDPVSGDKVWWFDFSSFKTEGTYYIADDNSGEKSAKFEISTKIYDNVLKAAVKSFYYQRTGFAKTMPYAGAGWVDGASHVGPLQDKNCRIYNGKNNASTEKDLSGGWYDAGDYNKYTPWTASYITSMLLAYKENPTAWTDDYNIPESGNGIPDLIDEVKWGMDWLLKMNQSDGSSLSIVALASASPPSAATGQSLYGPATTNATLRSAGAFALGAKYMRQANSSLSNYADTLQERAIKAYKWGIANPSITFRNNTNANGSAGVGAGNQETDSLGRFTAKMNAALYLYDLTGQVEYLKTFEDGIAKFPLILWGNYVSQYFLEGQGLLFYYLNLPKIDPTKATQIKSATLAAVYKSNDFLGAINNNTDPYRAFIKDYNWGSNQYKADYGNFLWQMQYYNLDPTKNDAYLKQAEEYLHYIHGVNPFGFVYLSNMGQYGAENNIKEFYHTWFANGSAKWDREGVSTYGPAPGFLVGGPNQFYTKDGCCPSNCGSAQNNAGCTNENVSPPLNQPPMKAYKDFNTSWPLNSWQVTENSCGYQIPYIRLLSKYVSSKISGIKNEDVIEENVIIAPNPGTGHFRIFLPKNEKTTLEIYNSSGQKVHSQTLESSFDFDVQSLPRATYFVKAIQGKNKYVGSFVKL
jgi:endoglucanase